MRVSLILFFLLPVLSACAMRDHGAVEYRRADPYFGGIGAPGEDGSTAGAHEPLMLTGLHRMNADPALSPRHIVANDSLTIRLDHAFFASFPEAQFTPERIFDDATIFVRRGEIAILVNAWEYPETQPGADSTDITRFDWRPNGIDSARVVYYSDDVESQQHANFNNLPILGPVNYHGRPIGIDIYMVEIDASSEHLKTLLSTLADQGAQLAPGSGQALNLLNGLGSALLNGRGDDVFFRYSMVLDPGINDPTMPTARLVPGRYVFYRNEDRNSPVDWSTLCMDHNTGRLHGTGTRLGGLPANAASRGAGVSSTCDLPTDARRVFRDQTYISLTITKGESVPETDVGLIRFSELIASIETEAESRFSNYETALNDISELLGSRVADHHFNELRTLLNTAENTAQAYATTHQLELTQSCRIERPNDLSDADWQARSSAIGRQLEANKDSAHQSYSEAAYSFHTRFVELLEARQAAEKTGSTDGDSPPPTNLRQC